MFALQLKTFLNECESEISTSVFPNSFNISTTGCYPVFKWTVAQYQMKENDSITVHMGSNVRATYKVQNLSGDV